MPGDSDRKRSILGTRVEVWAVKRLARRAALVIQDRFHGPIPARAGQPAPGLLRRCQTRAYPRSRGATRMASISCGVRRGLSPLARGNLFDPPLFSACVGPIPARAGQPASGFSVRCLARAYPRSRGATAARRIQYIQRRGLSPLARGNREKCPPV